MIYGKSAGACDAKEILICMIRKHVQTATNEEEEACAVTAV